MAFFLLPFFVLYFPTRKSTGTPTRDLEFGREVAFPFVSSLLGNFARTRAYCARAPYSAGYGRLLPYAKALHRREASLLQRAAVVRRASCGLQRTGDFRVACARAPAISQEEAQHANLLHARAVPRWLWLVRAIRKGIVPARGLSPVASGRGATCQVRPPTHGRFLRGTRARAAALAVSQEEAQHASLLYARALPRCLWLIHTICEGTVPARGLFSSALGRGATCQVQPQAHSRLLRGTRTRTAALAVSHEEAQHASLLHARAVLRWL